MFLSSKLLEKLHSLLCLIITQMAGQIYPSIQWSPNKASSTMEFSEATGSLHTWPSHDESALSYCEKQVPRRAGSVRHMGDACRTINRLDRAAGGSHSKCMRRLCYDVRRDGVEIHNAKPALSCVSIISPRPYNHSYAFLATVRHNELQLLAATRAACWHAQPQLP